MEPPPLPAPISFQTFHGKPLGWKNDEMATSSVANANQSAKIWMNANPDIEIVSISQGFYYHNAVVTVWYRPTVGGRQTRKPPNLPNQPS